MTSSQQPGRGLSRRFFWFAVAILAAIGLYSAGWFYAASRVTRDVDTALSDAKARGIEAECTNAQARGFPFRIGLFCDGIAWADGRQGLAVSGTGLRSAAQVYQPRRIVGEMDTLSVDFAPTGAAGRLSLSASDLRYSTRLASPLPALASIEGRDVGLRSGETSLATASRSIAHMRPNGSDLDIAGEVEGLVLHQLRGGGTLPPLRVTADITAKDGVTAIVERQAGLRGRSAEIRDLSVDTGDTGATITGTVSVGDDGLVNGDLRVALRNAPALVALLPSIFPEIRPQIVEVGGIVSALGNNPQLPVSIRRGVVRLGVFTIGRLPPVD